MDELKLIPGVHLEWDDAAYFADSAFNHSSLKSMSVSPEIFYLENIEERKTPPTPSMDLGTICHDAVLRPELINQYTRADEPINPSTCEPYGKGSKAYARWRRSFGSQIPLTNTDFATMTKVVGSCAVHPRAKPLLDACVATELGLRYADPQCGLALKCKFDGLILNPKNIGNERLKSAIESQTRIMTALDDIRSFLPNVAELPPLDDLTGIIVDLKTSAMYDQFKSTSRKHAYYRADAFYSHIGESVFGGQFIMLFIVADVGPLAARMGRSRVKVRAYSADDRLRGKSEMDTLLGKIRTCITTKDWTDKRDQEIEVLNLFKGMPGDFAHAVANAQDAL